MGAECRIRTTSIFSPASGMEHRVSALRTISRDAVLSTAKVSARGFTKKYGVNRLVYVKCFDDARFAIRREKQLKIWNRKWKLELIERTNPQWLDL